MDTAFCPCCNKEIYIRFVKVNGYCPVPGCGVPLTPEQLLAQPAKISAD